MPRKTNFSVNGSEYFRVTATIGKKPDGKPIRKQFYGVSKKDAENKRDEYLSGLKQGLAIDYDKATFANAFEHWLEHVHRSSVSISTYTGYKAFHRLHIASCELAGMRLAEIRGANIQACFNAMLERISASNVRRVYKIMRIFFRYCLKADILVKNPLLSVELPKVPEKVEVNTALSDADVQKLIAAAQEDIKIFPFVFCAFTGLRSGELLALTYKDIDFKDAMVTVNKTVKRLKVNGEYQPVVSDTKTVGSIRRVPLLAEIRGLLNKYIAYLGDRTKIVTMNGDFILFPSDTDEYRYCAEFLRAFKRLCERLDITQGCTVHSLRHTFCTILARQGVSILDASRLMGHTNINITAQIYSHVSDHEKKSAVEKLSAYFN
ncbi:MAG: site-specific integrase [Oscillospiraceae bacterium]|nr:site-specific integrase [Oscillospiraceae bacterium]